ncbi:hypothetical protein E8E11_001889 [Didymella keratinophila]|nr:hypothetical protein E8E11_001889 [Didymella keratinophila]
MSLSTLCTVSNVQAALPVDGTLLGLNLLSDTVTAAPVYNASVGGGMMGAFTGGATYNYCNVTVSYSHIGKNDTIALKYALPEPSNFKNCFYLSGGELTKIGKPLTQAFYGLNNTRLYTYFKGCSDGGREGMSQVQRWGTEYDGVVVAGAPAFRFAQQQVHHVHPATVEQVMGYFPPPCALNKIVNVTIAAYNPLGGRTDGYCAAESSSSLGFGFSKRHMGGGTAGSQSSTKPEQNGTIIANDIAVAQAVYDGLHSSDGKRAYLSSWKLNIPSTGGEYVTKFIQLFDFDNPGNLDGVTYDTLVEWINTGMIRYLDSLQTTLPDLTPF